MPDLDLQRLEIAYEVQQQIGRLDVLTPNQARSFVRGLQVEWEVPQIRWRDGESHNQFQDAQRLLGAANIFERAEGEESANAISCYQRVGELLEWLARSGDHLGTFVSLHLLASAAYQLGQLPAMAAALLGHSPQNRRGDRLYANFLRADFDAVLEEVALFWSENLDITGREGTSRILEEEGDDKTSWFITIELIRAIGAFADGLRRGDEQRVSLSLRKLQALDQLALRTLSDEASIFLLLVRKVAETYQKSNIYSSIRQLAKLNPDRVMRLELFARTQFERKRGILWTSQHHGISRLVEDSSFALCTPTGSGKTLVATLALLKELLLRGEADVAPLALYLVPSRALASEVEAKLNSEIGQDFVVTGLYGGADWGVTDYWINADQPTVLIATVEKADALMRYLAPHILARLSLLIVDEAHQVVPDASERTITDFAEHRSRSIRLESFVSRLLAHLPDVARIALTAVAGGAALPVSRWIEGSQDAEVVGIDYRSTRQIVGTLETRPNSPGQMTIDIFNGRNLVVGDRDESVYIPLRIPPMPQLPAMMRNSLNRFNELSVLWTALHLINAGRRILISVAQQPEKTMGWFADVINRDEWKELLSFQPPPDNVSRQQYEETRAVCIDYCGMDSYELALLDCGIATNHGQMPQRLRRLMTRLVESGICQITVATATLTEGVNLPFDIIFVTSLIRRSFDPIRNTSVENPISTSEFRNLAGRAGRPGSSNSIEGLTLVALPQQPSTTARATLARQRRQIANLKENYENLKQSLFAEEDQQGDVYSPMSLLVQVIAFYAQKHLGLEGEAFLQWLNVISPGNISADAGQGDSSDEGRLADSIDELDGILLGAIEEARRMRPEELNKVEIENLLATLWRRTFSNYASAHETWLETAFVNRGSALVERIYPDADERKRLYQYGFTPHVGRSFEKVAPNIREIIEAASGYGNSTPEQRVHVFTELGQLLFQERSYGFQVRSTVSDQELLNNWETVLRWWMLVPGTESPPPEELRAWQRFVSENIDFRLGVAVGAVVANAWTEGAEDPLDTPSLDNWRETTKLPWFGFWVRELLRWGTLDPFVAFSLSQGLGRSRQEASERRQEFENWLLMTERGLDSENLIDPQLFLAWQRDLPSADKSDAQDIELAVEITGTSGALGTYHVIPVLTDDRVVWIDAAGYALAESARERFQYDTDLFKRDFELRTSKKQPFVECVYR